MSTLREGILTALQVLMQPVIPGAVFRSREAAVAREESPAILIRPEDEVVVNQNQRLAMRDLVVCITVITRAQIPDQAADPIVQAAHAAITADQTLGGLAARIIETGTKWEFEVADLNASAVEMRFTIRYLTQVTTLSTSA